MVSRKKILQSVVFKKIRDAGYLREWRLKGLESDRTPSTLHRLLYTDSDTVLTQAPSDSKCLGLFFLVVDSVLLFLMQD